MKIKVKTLGQFIEFGVKEMYSAYGKDNIQPEVFKELRRFREDPLYSMEMGALITIPEVEILRNYEHLNSLYKLLLSTSKVVE